MQKIGVVANRWLCELDPELQKAATASRVRSAFVQAVLEVFSKQRAALFVLDHVQAVYVMRDTDRATVARRPENPQILLKVYSDDSSVRAEIDARQEFIRLALAKRNITYDRCQIFASKLGMRTREPLSSLLHEGDVEAEDVERHGLSCEEMDSLASRIADPEVAAAFRRALDATRSAG